MSKKKPSGQHLITTSQNDTTRAQPPSDNPPKSLNKVFLVWLIPFLGLLIYATIAGRCG